MSFPFFSFINKCITETFAFILFYKNTFFVCPRSSLCSRSEVGLPLQDGAFEVTDVQRRRSKHFSHLPVAGASAISHTVHANNLRKMQHFLVFSVKLHLSGCQQKHRPHLECCLSRTRASICNWSSKRHFSRLTPRVFTSRCDDGGVCTTRTRRVWKWAERCTGGLLFWRSAGRLLPVRAEKLLKPLPQVQTTNI